MSSFHLSGDHIELSKLLKAANITASGGEAKTLIADGRVLVNGETEIRRGRKVRSGDQVQIDNEIIHVLSQENPEVPK